MKLPVKVIVNSKNSDIIEDGIDLFGDRFLKIKVNQLPEDGKANKEVIRLSAQYFGIKVRNIRIIKGETLVVNPQLEKNHCFLVKYVV
jgi:uncharacterized protein YggU (UPF0235/DUF167 family)